MAQSTSLLAAALATALLAGVHAAVPALRRRLSARGEDIAASVGGGVAAAYVFLHLLPEVATGNQDVAELFGEQVEVTMLGDVLLFLAAFAGFVVLYGLDHLAARSQRTEQSGIFAVHLGVFALYNALITYTLPTRFQEGIDVAALFVVAMALHFTLSDRSLAEHYPHRFRSIGRPVLVAALAVGYALAWAFAPARTVVVSVLLAILGGFVLYNVFSDELPSEHTVRFRVFALSAGIYAALLLTVTVAEA